MNVLDRLCPVNQHKEICAYLPGNHQSAHLLEKARKRPAMYVGSVGASGVRGMLYDVLDLLVNPYSPYHNHQISLELSEDRIIIRSNQMIPDMESQTLVSLSLPVAAALSRCFRLSLTIQGQCSCRSFEKGILLEETHRPGGGDAQIEVCLQPDREIFSDCEIDYFSLFDRCYTLAALYPGVTVLLKGEMQQNCFCFPEGMRRFLDDFGPAFLSADENVSWAFARETDGVLLRGAIRKSRRPGKVLSYVNGYPTPRGGAHVEGVRRGIIRALNQSGKKGPRGCRDCDDYVRDHYDLAIAVWLDRASWAGSEKQELTNMELVAMAADVVEPILRGKGTQSL